MAQYDFTVRAEDETGAFADRTFNIEVQNNLVDKFAYCDDTDIYTSIDGVNWTKRNGKGTPDGRMQYAAGWWILYDSSGRFLRRSRDGITWYDVEPTMKIEGFHPSFDNSIGWNSLRMYNQRFTVIDGAAYFFSDSLYTYKLDPVTLEKTSGYIEYSLKVLFRTTDFETFTAINVDATKDFFSVYDSTDYSIIGDFFTGDGRITHVGNSNIIKVDNFYYAVFGNNVVYRSIDMTAWERITLINNVVNASGGRDYHLINVNGIIVCMRDEENFNNKTNSASIDTAVSWTTDMFNWNQSNFQTNDTGKSLSTRTFYVNGVFVMMQIEGNYLKFSKSTDLVNWTAVKNYNPSWPFSGSINYGLVEYKGELYMNCMQKNPIWKINVIDETAEGFSSLPSLPRCAIAVIK